MIGVEIVASKAVKTHAQAEMVVGPCNPPAPLARGALSVVHFTRKRGWWLAGLRLNSGATYQLPRF